MRLAGEVPLPSLIPQGDVAGLGNDIFRKSTINQDKGFTIEELRRRNQERNLRELLEGIQEEMGPGQSSVRGA